MGHIVYVLAPTLAGTCAWVEERGEGEEEEEEYWYWQYWEPALRQMECHEVS